MSNSFGALCFFLRCFFFHCVFLHSVSRFSPAFLFVNSPTCCCSFTLPSITIWVETRAKSEKSAKICAIFFWYTLFCFLRWAKHHKNRLPKRINPKRVSHAPLLRNRPFFENVQIHTHTRLTRARARLPTAMLIFCCHKCHTRGNFEGKIKQFLEGGREIKMTFDSRYRCVFRLWIPYLLKSVENTP